MDAQPKLRLSRPTNHLEAILSFYVDGLGFEVLDRFDNQQGWDGVILGHRDWHYQFEFTARRDESVVPPAPARALPGLLHSRGRILAEASQGAL